MKIAWSGKLYAETGSFTVPSNLAGELTVKVRAVSMFDDVADSDEITAGATVLNPVLPDPDVRIQVVSSKENEYKHTYEYSLNNQEAYKDYTGWQVEITVQSVGTITLDAEHPQRPWT
ncbi:MAG: hypothetical protein V8Q40_09935 [Anaerosacchariphilus sp.]